MLQSYKVCPGLTAGSRVFLPLPAYMPPPLPPNSHKKGNAGLREGESTWMRAIPTRGLTVPVGSINYTTDSFYLTSLRIERTAINCHRTQLPGTFPTAGRLHSDWAV